MFNSKFNQLFNKIIRQQIEEKLFNKQQLSSNDIKELIKTLNNIYNPRYTGDIQVRHDNDTLLEAIYQFNSVYDRIKKEYIMNIYLIKTSFGKFKIDNIQIKQILFDPYNNSYDANDNILQTFTNIDEALKYLKDLLIQKQKQETKRNQDWENIFKYSIGQEVYAVLSKGSTFQKNNCTTKKGIIVGRFHDIKRDNPFLKKDYISFNLKYNIKFPGGQTETFPEAHIGSTEQEALNKIKQINNEYEKVVRQFRNEK